MAPISLTCIKCKETFKDRDSQRAHYGSEWHRLNITRLQKGLPVIDEDNHKELVQKQTYLQQVSEIIFYKPAINGEYIALLFSHLPDQFKKVVSFF